MLSNTPIQPGDEVVAFVLRGPSTKTPYQPHHFTEPISLPIQARYTPDEDIPLKAAETPQTAFSRDFITQYSNLYATDINALLCALYSEGTYSFLYQRGYEGMLQYALMHAHLYATFIEDITPKLLPPKTDIIKLIQKFRNKIERPALLLTMDPRPWPYSLSIYMGNQPPEDDALWESLADLYTLCGHLKGLRRQWYYPTPYNGVSGNPLLALQAKLLQHSLSLVEDARREELDWLGPELHQDDTASSPKPDNSRTKKFY